MNKAQYKSMKTVTGIITVATLTLLAGIGCQPHRQPLENTSSIAPPSPALETGSPSKTAQNKAEAYGQLPLYFEQNQGQTDKAIKFLSRNAGYTLFIKPAETVLVMQGTGAGDQGSVTTHDEQQTTDNSPAIHTVRMQLINANQASTLAGGRPLPGAVNYLIGRDEKDWRTNIPTFGEVIAKDVYPGIDLRYHGQQHQLEYDFIVAPGINPDIIQLQFDGVDRLRIDTQGDLVLHTPAGELQHKQPVIYQDINGERVTVEGHYKLIPKTSHRPRATRHTVGFQIAAYDKSQPLIIDPVLDYSTYLGGEAHDTGLAIAVDEAGSAYISGVTSSVAFPIADPAQGALSGNKDMFIAKLTPEGDALAYATYLGGSRDEGEPGADGDADEDLDDDEDDDIGQNIAVNRDGEVVVTGTTASSTDFPLVNALQPAYGGGPRDAFVVKLSADGSNLLYSTYLGGSKHDKALGVAIDTLDQAVVTGVTHSTDFPTVNAWQEDNAGNRDAFITQLNSSGDTALFSSYFGGKKADQARAIALDPNDHIYISGWTRSTDFPVSADAYQSHYGGGDRDAFVSQLSPDGQTLMYSTYLGGSQRDRVSGIAVDETGAATVTGWTFSDSDFPMTAGAIQSVYGGGDSDAFITQLNAAGSALRFSTYLGGEHSDKARSIAMDHNGLIYVTGYTDSTAHFPLVDALQTSNSGSGVDAFITALSSDGRELIYSTFFGGSDNDRGHAIAVDDKAGAYIAGFTRSALDFPIENAAQPFFGGGGRDAFVAKITQPSGNTAPEIISTPVTTAELNRLYIYDVDAEDAEDDPLTFRLTEYPAGMVIDEHTGVISWTPNTLEAVNVTVEVSDGHDEASTDEQRFTINVIDTIAPIITLTSPQDGLLTHQPQQTIIGSVNEPATVTINGDPISLNPDNSFAHVMTLNEGDNSIVVAATDVSGNPATPSILNLTLDTIAPVITVTHPPAPDSVTNQAQLTITGVLSEPVDSFTLNNVRIPVNPDLSFSIGPITLTEEPNSFTLDAVDLANNNADDVLLNVTLDKVPPVLTIEQPQDNTLTNQTNVLFSGSVSEPVTLTIDGQDITINPDLTFSSPVALAEGDNPVALVATDLAGNPAPETIIHVTVDTTPPLLDINVINRGNPQGGIVMVAGQPGAAEAGALVHVINPANGYEALVLAETDGSFSTDVAGFANDSFQVYAEDAAGNQTTLHDLPPSTPLTLILDPIGHKTAPIGQVTTFTVTANDSSGEPIALGLTPLPLPEGMRYNIVTGELKFKPKLSQVGDIELTFSAETPDERVTETITITVPPVNAADPTVFSGRVLDANSFAQGLMVPVVNATITFMDSGIETTTDHNGYFTLTNLPANSTVFSIDGETANPAPTGAGYASFREAIPLDQHVVNLVERPFFMPRIAAESLTDVIPGQPAIVNNPALGVTMTILADTARNEDGSLFTGQASISVVPRDLTPAALPATMDPGLVITIQPVGLSFDTPAPISFPNIDHLPPGTELDIFSLDPDTGTFGDVGDLRVSADGMVLETTQGGIPQSSWSGAWAGPPKGAERQDNKDNPCNCPQKPLTSTTTLTDGRMNTAFTLPAYRSLEASRALTFTYQTHRAWPMPIIPVISGFDANRNIAKPPLFSHDLQIAGLQPRDIFYDTAHFDRRDEIFMGVSFDASDFESGVYDYDLILRSHFVSSDFGTGASSTVIIENEMESPFGAGWMLRGLYRLAFNADGSVLLISPEGRPVNYRPTATPDVFAAPDNDYATFLRHPDGSYTHTEKDGIKLHFDAQGRLTAREDRNRNRTAYRYNADGQLVTITDPAELITTLIYDHNGLLDTVTDPANRISTFEHDAAGNLITITYPDGTFQSFGYDDRHLMIAHEDERQNRSTNRYDEFGHVIDGTLPDTSVRAVSPQWSAGLVFAAEGEGTAANPLVGAIAVNDVQGGYIDGRGKPSSQQLDRHGRALIEIDELGRITTHERDTDSNPTQTTRPIGSVVTRTFDSLGNVLTQKEEFNNATTTYTYDDFSLVTSVTNPRNHATTIHRDPANGNPLSIVNHLGHTTTIEYNSRGLVTRMTSPNGLITEYTYNDEGLMDSKTETPPVDSPGNVREWSYDYFPTGLLQTVHTPDGITLNYQYDERSMLTRVTDNLDQSITYTYDDHKNVIKTETSNSDGSLALLVDSVYDDRNRLIETRAPHVGVEESITQRILDENSNLIGLIDPNGNPSSNSYDPYNRLETNTHRENGITEYQYDAQDRIVKVIAPNEVTTHYEYDIIGRRTKEISPDRGTLRYAYDRANNVTSITDARGITATMTYDELERVVSKTYPNSIPGKIEDVSYSYDTCAFGLGYLCTRTDESGQYHYKYDAFGNLTAMDFAEIEGTVYTTAYGYDDGDNIIQMTLPSGRVVDYTRDGIRRMESLATTINGQLTTIISGIRYRGDNQVTQCTFGNGLVDERQYDLQGRLLNQQLKDAANNIIDERAYRYDKNSNILDIATNFEQNAYQFDKLDRLTQDTIDTDTPIDFSYDLNDNRLTKAFNDLTLEEFFEYVEDAQLRGSNRLGFHETVQVGATPLQNIKPREMVYNDVGRLYQLFEDGVLKVAYIYNDEGQRIRKTIFNPDGTVNRITVFHYDQQGYLVTETNEQGGLIKDYIWSENMTPIAQIDSDGVTETVSYLYTDHLYTNRLATDQNQNVIWRWEGEAFGNTAPQELAGISINLRFPGQYFDNESNLFYNRMRYYDPQLGRYITSDPIGLRGGLNTYLYANANPIVNIDPFGLAPKLSERRGAKDLIHGSGDLLDSSICQWWPAACLFQCVRWRCSRKGECGQIEYYFIGQGYPYAASPGYDPNEDEDCKCVKRCAKGQWDCPGNE